MVTYLTREVLLAYDGPAIVLTDNLFSVVSTLIRLGQRSLKAHVSGRYQHAMWLESAGVVVSQDWKLQRRPLADYLTGKHRVKLFIDPAWTDEQKAIIRGQLAEDVAGDHRYDWLGILGHLLRLPRINFPNRWYCSEHAASILSKVDSRFLKAPHLSPAVADVWLRSFRYEVYGVFDPYND